MTVYPSPLESLADLMPAVLSARREGEQLRQLPPTIATELGARGFGRLCLPRDTPGHELDPDSLMTVMEQLAQWDASVALVIFNNCLPALVSRHLDATVRAQIFADPHGLYATSTRPSGRAIPTASGYLVSGRWSLVTGCQHAGWFGLMALEWNQEKEAPIKADGHPRLLMAMVPADQVEIIDTWDAVGVRASGSHDVTVDEVEVPTERVVDFASPNQLDHIPIGRVPWMSVLAAAHGSISAGIAQSASVAFRELMAGKKSADTGASLTEHPALQVEFLDVDEASRAARERLRTTMHRVWGYAVEGSTPPVDVIADVFGAARLTANSAKRLTETVLRWGGTAALSTDGVIERSWRDVNAVNQHLITGPVMAEQAGRVRLGLDPKIPSFTW